MLRPSPFKQGVGQQARGGQAVAGSARPCSSFSLPPPSQSSLAPSIFLPVPASFSLFPLVFCFLFFPLSFWPDADHASSARSSSGAFRTWYSCSAQVSVALGWGPLHFA